MNRRRFVVGVVVAAATIANLGCSDDDRGDTHVGASLGWSVAVDDDTLGLRFVLPSEPERLVQRIQLPDGTPSEIVVYSTAGEGWELFVSTLPLDVDSYDLDAAAPGAAAGVEGELVEVRPVTVGGHPGRDAEIRYRRDGEERVLLYRAVAIDDGLVQIQTLGPASNRPQLDRFHRELIDGITFG